MMNFVKCIAVGLVELLAACATVSRPPLCSSAEQFRQCDECTVTGVLMMSSDGHGFIGKLLLEDGDCLNVSLSSERSRRLMDQPAQQITVSGTVLPYPVVADSEGLVLGYRVKGRPVGRGLCGDYFLFVQ